MKFVIMLALALTLGACISLHNGYRDVKAGMSSSQVRHAMEACPNLKSKNGRYSSATYIGRMPDFFQLNPANYAFVFKDDVLVEFGEGNAVNAIIAGEPGIKLIPPVTEATLKTKTPTARCAS